jgi:superfamily II DNA or RNA helicase
LRFAYITGEDTAKRRKRILELFRQRKIDVLIGNKILDEGIDLPLMETLILASGGKAEHRQIQRIGRVMRTHEGKERATVFDFMDGGYYLSKHSEGRLLAYEMEPAFEVAVIHDYEFDELFKGG